MLKMTLRGLLKNKIRFFLTAAAVVLGVTFVVASFVVTDGLRSTFTDLSSDLYSTQDFTVRGAQDQDIDNVSETYVDEIAAIPGVGKVLGTLFVDETIPIDGDGESPSLSGAPVAGVNWTGDPLANFLLLDGEAPDGAGEFAIDQTTFDEGNYTFGETYGVSSTANGREDFTLTGTFRFGLDEDASVGARFVAFEDETAQRFLGYETSFNEIGVALEPGASTEQIQAEISALLDPTAEVITGAEAEAEFNSDFEGFIGPFRTILLVFAFIILFVSAFLINNTFTIIIGQRVRELGLLRTIGATGRQVRQSVLLEAVVVGLVATAIGTGLGLLAARAIIWLLESQGAAFPDGPLPLEPRTIIFALVVGVLVTLIAAYVPARHAAKISPMEALRDNSSLDETRTKRRSITGGLLALIGVGGTLLGLFGSFDEATPRLIVLALGAIFSFIAVAVLSPLLVKPVVTVIGAPISAFANRAGKLATSNASRSPQRTAGTAVALTIGLALVSTVTIVGASLKSTVSDALSSSVNADYIVTGFNDIPAGLANEMSTTPEIGDFSAMGGESALVNGVDRWVESVNFESIEGLINADLIEGSYDASGNNTVIFKDLAEELELGVGDTLAFEFPGGTKQDFTIAGIFSDDTFLDPISIDVADFDKYFTNENDSYALIASGADGVTPEESRAAIDGLIENYPQLSVQDQAEYLESVGSQIDQLLGIINVFLGLAVLIALIGIVNTLTLSVFERTRELGLLRAVGMTRRQVRRMVRWEAVIVAVFGAILGVGLGVLFGWAISDAIPDGIVAKATFPVGQLLGFIVAAVIVGLLAAIFPARRASRLNILDAISS